MAKSHRTIPTLSEKEIALFWSYVDKNGPIPEHVPHLGPCWMWLSNTLPKGYGLFRISGTNGRHCYAHRIAYTLQYGPIPDGLIVLHGCDNPSCCNYDHLTAGTHKDNMRDSLKKGRFLVGDRHPSRSRPDYLARGESHKMSRLKEEDVREIRRIYAIKEKNQYELASQFRVCVMQINRIINRKRWAHID